MEISGYISIYQIFNNMYCYKSYGIRTSLLSVTIIIFILRERKRYVYIERASSDFDFGALFGKNKL